MIAKYVEKAKEKGRLYATIRKDVVRRMIEAGKYKKMECRYSLTDDYADDAERNFGKGELSRDEALQVADDWLTPGADTRCYIDVGEPHVIRIRPYRNLLYYLYI